MALSLDPKSAALKDLDAFKSYVKSKGYTTKVILDDKTMERVAALVTSDKRYILTPEPELRYLEGLLELPLGTMKEFGTVPAKGHEKCGCGRVPSALDIVVTALKRGVHGKALVRDTVLGLENVFEIAESGRDAMCIGCGRLVQAVRYHYKRPYLYA
jgi:hypothetical protein